MRIGELAAESGVSVRALRYYEEQGLLESERSSGGQRVYAGNAAQQVRWIRQLYAAGLSSKAIRSLLPCVHTGLLAPEMMERLHDERARVDHQINELTQARERLDQVIAQAVVYAAEPVAA